MNEKRVIVLDTSAFVAGFDPFSISEKQYTVPLVRDELSKGSMSWIRFKAAVENGLLKVKKPDKVFVEKVREAATFLGDSFFLSKADMQVLALALQLKTRGCEVSIATDDYSIQNVANQLGVKFASLATFGIRFRSKWVRYCPACHKKYPADYKHERCEVCGTMLKRKMLRKTTLKE
ncbi:hypothetical protein CW667_01675 [Candidatus Bathyarchaeota archaeon]|nr:MAG: hypothetical protein CW667_01675 [Candidatus Bathyarchaeota archaeon]HDD70127.1 hypothetical protein [Candidatus Bathyarchaeota archaeon]